MPSTCRIKSLSIREGMQASDFAFSDHCTLIHSGGMNSVGKTTLLRCILYALGEDASSTSGLDFSKLEFRVRFARDGEELVCLRSGDILRVVGGDGARHVFSIKGEVDSIRHLIWGFDSRLVRENYLGAVFIDQDKGWTLLNRGKVTSGIPFKIEKFIDGLSGERGLELSMREKGLNDKIERYKVVMGVVDARKSVESRREGLDAPDLGAKRAMLSGMEVERAALMKRRRAVRRVVEDNERFVRYVEDMGLRVSVGEGEPVVIKRDNLVGWGDASAYHEAELGILSGDIAKIDAQIADVKAEMSGDESLFRVASSIEGVERQIAQLSIDGNAIESTLEELKVERKKVRNELKELLSSGNEVCDFLSNAVYGLASKLGVGDVYLKDTNGLLTNSVKEKSGTSRQLLVAAFRLGYARAIERFAGVRVPLIIDSPKNGEMSRESFELLESLLRDEFADWQVIIASIYSAGFRPDKEILIERRLMENGKPVADIEAWERGE